MIIELKIVETKMDEYTHFLCAVCLLLATFFSTWGCAREPGILVNLAMWPEGAEHIRVRTKLAGIPGTDIYLDHAQSRFVVRFPEGSQGTVQLDAVGLDVADCKIAVGGLMESVPDSHSYFIERTLELMPQSPRACIFSSEIGNYNAGSKPSSVAVGDFNSDKILDLIVANYGSNNVSLLLGNGQGAFGPLPANSDMGNGPISIAVGDFNGDQKPDVATANFIEHTVGVRLGTILGGLSELKKINISRPPETMEKTNPVSIAVGEFNGDGKLDLVVAKFYSNEVSVLRGDGLGGFEVDSTFCASELSPCEVTRPYAIAVTDLDGDQKSDLVFANYNPGNIRGLLGNGGGGFASVFSHPVGDNPQGIAVADLNHDGRPDLLTANSGSNNVSMSLNLSGGLVAARSFPVGLGPISMAVGDFNGDHELDLAVANFGTQAVPGKDISVLLGNGQNGFRPATQFSVGSRPQGIAVGDFNGDGRPDLAVTNSDDNTVSILLNQF